MTAKTPHYTIDDLCRDLAEKTAREGMKWGVNGFGWIRTADGVCPVRYVLDAGTLNYLAEIEARGMTTRDVDALLDAADHEKTKHSQVRAQLLAATGVV